MPLLSRLKSLSFTSRSAPFALLALCLLAFGIYLPWMGFYWDDWPAVWFIHASGPEVLTRLEFHRPLSGLFLSLAAQLLGVKPLNWQILNFVLRWLSALALWWTAGQLWPQHRRQTLWLALFFAVYPGFGQQFVSINSSRHILGLTQFLFSLGAMLAAQRSARRYVVLTALSLLLALAAMLTTEYYYGLEFLRPVLLYLASNQEEKRARDVLKRWWPYALVFLGLIAWRAQISRYGNYPIINPIGALSGDLLAGLRSYARIIFGDLFEVTLGAWAQAFALPVAYGSRTVLYDLILVLVCAAAAFIYLGKHSPNQSEDVWGKNAVTLGILALLLGGASFWATGLQIKLDFPADRATLAMMLGATLLLVGLLDWLIRSQMLKLALLSALLGIFVGYHFQNALAYRADWESLKSLLTQLTWRAPALQDGTLLLSEELPVAYASDNSLAAPLNWTYAPAFSPDVPLDRWYFDNISRPRDPSLLNDTSLAQMPYFLLYLDLRLGTLLPKLREGVRVSQTYRYYRYDGNTDQALLLYDQPPYCLRVLDPVYDRYHPLLLGADYYREHPDQIDPVLSLTLLNFPDFTARALPLSRPEQIAGSADSTASLPSEIFGDSLPPDWCYYFEQADLARQQGNWERVAELGGQALPEYTPRHASELLPFIEAYARLGRWDDAQALTLQALDSNPAMQLMLCDLYARLASDSPAALSCP